MTFSICGCYTCLFLVKFRLASTKRYCAGSPEGQIPFLPSWCNIHCTSSQKIKVNDTSSLAIPSSVAGLLTQGPPKLPSFRHSLKFKGTLAMFLMVSPLGISTSPYINPGISGMGRADFQSGSLEIMVSKIIPMSASWFWTPYAACQGWNIIYDFLLY